ncbi:hydrogenase expression protein [Pseudomonas syringae pv. actinidifoliorum]|nr:hydrogenase expression protein [Pseudomonas syringae pv. actinidifoliorum]
MTRSATKRTQSVQNGMRRGASHDSCNRSARLRH